MDAELAGRIATDQRFVDDFDYVDENADRLARKKLKTDAQKKLFAINGVLHVPAICSFIQITKLGGRTDFARTRKVLDTCHYCFHDLADASTRPPQVPIVALGTRVYLALPRTEVLVDGQCIIVPLQHHLSSLDADDDTWEEIRVSNCSVLSRSFYQAAHFKASTEFYENLDAMLRCSRQRCRFHGDRDDAEATATHRDRSHPNSLGSVRRLPCVFQGTTPNFFG